MPRPSTTGRRRNGCAAGPPRGIPARPARTARAGASSYPNASRFEKGTPGTASGPRPVAASVPRGPCLTGPAPSLSNRASRSSACGAAEGLWPGGDWPLLSAFFFSWRHFRRHSNSYHPGNSASSTGAFPFCAATATRFFQRDRQGGFWSLSAQAERKMIVHVACCAIFSGRTAETLMASTRRGSLRYGTEWA